MENKNHGGELLKNESRWLTLPLYSISTLYPAIPRTRGSQAPGNHMSLLALESFCLQIVIGGS